MMFFPKARRAIVGTLEDTLNNYEADSASTDTVADIIANVLSDLLGEIGILNDDVFVTYYEHENNQTVGYDAYDATKDFKSLMWTIVST